MMISPSSESHQQVVAVGQPLAVQPQGTVMVKYFSYFCCQPPKILDISQTTSYFVANFCTFVFMFAKFYHYSYLLFFTWTIDTFRRH